VRPGGRERNPISRLNTRASISRWRLAHLHPFLHHRKRCFEFSDRCGDSRPLGLLLRPLPFENGELSLMFRRLIGPKFPLGRDKRRRRLPPTRLQRRGLHPVLPSAPAHGGPRRAAGRPERLISTQRQQTVCRRAKLRLTQSDMLARRRVRGCAAVEDIGDFLEKLGMPEYGECYRMDIHKNVISWRSHRGALPEAWMD
jgi:hypothetical protein